MYSSNKPILMQIEPIVSSHKWTIKNFTSILERKNVAAGFHITSPKFLTSWFLRLFPFSDQDSEDFISLFVFQSEKAEIKATVKLSILNRKSEKVCERLVVEVFKRNEDWGYRKFIKRSVITNKDFGVLNDNDLTVQCELFLDDRFSILKNEPSVSLTCEEFEFNGFEKLLGEEKFSDITFIVEERYVKAHKNILAIRSPFFNNMIARGDNIKKDKNITIRIKDVKYDVFKELLRFLYAGKVYKLEEIAKDLWIAAEKYAVKELKVVCEKTLCDRLTLENVLEFLTLADDKKLPNLKNLAVEFISLHVNDLIVKPDFKSLKFELMCDIIREVANNRMLINKLASRN